MRLIIIRHGDPDYKCDGLTERGRKEAQALAKRVSKWNVADFYVSPLGRALETAEPSLKAMGREAVTVPWLREFSYPVEKPLHDKKGVCWDFIPSTWADDEAMCSMEGWLNVPPASDNPDIKENYHIVLTGLDALLAKYGYIRCGNYYKNINSKNRRIYSTVVDHDRHLGNEMPDEDEEPIVVMFCHFGVTCVMLSHLLNIPFYALTHGTIIPPTGVTVVNVEERWDDQAYFRVQSLGDVSHLRDAGLDMSSAGSFLPLFKG